jgi:hypothetical protein
MLSAAASGNPARKRYRNKVTRSWSWTSVNRVYGDTSRIIQPGTKPRGKHQASGGKRGRDGKVYAYDPPDEDGPFTCCNGQCYRQYQDSADPRVKKARTVLFDTDLTKPAMRDAMRANWKEHLLLSDGGSVCQVMACRIFGCSKMKFNPDKRAFGPKVRLQPSQPAAQEFTFTKAEQIAAWFGELKEVSDVMPDEGWYQLNEPLRYMVHENYEADCKQFPNLYTSVSQSYFYDNWRRLFPEVRLRRHCKFAKCSFCVRWRMVIERATSSANQKAEAKARMRAHRSWAITRERGLFKTKRNQAIQNPKESISISMDGTDKVTH